MAQWKVSQNIVAPVLQWFQPLCIFFLFHDGKRRRKINSKDKHNRRQSFYFPSLCQTVDTTNSMLSSALCAAGTLLLRKCKSHDRLNRSPINGAAGERLSDCSLNVDSTAPSLGCQRIDRPTCGGGVSWNTLIINLTLLHLRPSKPRTSKCSMFSFWPCDYNIIVNKNDTYAPETLQWCTLYVLVCSQHFVFVLQ